uniref:Uncharacterized protein n=1 Tax=Rhizophora mucronata TaxID=61149 RepID=A0A2P2MC84_RHIMU
MLQRHVTFKEMSCSFITIALATLSLQVTLNSRKHIASLYITMLVYKFISIIQNQWILHSTIAKDSPTDKQMEYLQQETLISTSLPQLFQPQRQMTRLDFLS